jgi:phospholipase C
VFDHWFASILSSTYPNRFYTHAARTDRIENDMRTTNLPTIWDRLADAGVPATYYFSDLPFLALWGEKYVPIARPVDTFFADAAAGRLTPFSYLDPFFLGEDQGGSNDDHPHADIRRGQAFVSLVARAVATSPQWSSTVLVITYDEWGGFFDHVRPPRLPDDHVTVGKEFDHSQAGFRVPAFVFSPFARRGAIDHHTYDHTSMLKLVEWRFGLQPLSARDRHARNLALALDFAHPNTSAPSLPLVLDPGPHVCGAPGGPMALEEPFWLGLKAKMDEYPAWHAVAHSPR